MKLIKEKIAEGIEDIQDWEEINQVVREKIGNEYALRIENGKKSTKSSKKNLKMEKISTGMKCCAKQPKGERCFVLSRRRECEKYDLHKYAFAFYIPLACIS